MYDANRQMVLTLSVDLPKKRGAHAVKQLASLLRRFSAGATFCVDHVEDSEALEAVQRAGDRFDLGLQASSQWASAEAGRVTFARELSRRWNLASRSGALAGVLALRGVERIEHGDLLAKLGVEVVRDCPAAPPAANRTKPLRFGVWSANVVARFPATSNWPFGGPAAKLKCELQAAGAAHLAIEAGEVLRDPSVQLGKLEQLFQSLAALRRSGALRIEPLSGHMRRLRRGRETAPQRSILRAA